MTPSPYSLETWHFIANSHCNNNQTLSSVHWNVRVPPTVMFIALRQLVTQHADSMVFSISTISTEMDTVFETLVCKCESFPEYKHKNFAFSL